MTRHRQTLLIAASAAVIAIIALSIAVYQISRARCFVLVGSVTCRVETDVPLVALTFDDGPTQLGLDSALPVLARASAHATFFAVGSHAAEHPEQVARVLAAGDEIGNHSWSHQRMAFHLPAFYESEVDRADAAIMAAGAPRPTLFRPPYGKKLIGLPLLLERRGERMITWDVEDPTTDDPRVYADEVVRNAEPGSIILMHIMFGSNRTARQALPLVVAGLQARGLRIGTVSELLRSVPN